TETVTLTGTGAVPASDLTPALPAGSYQFTASYSGGANCRGTASGPEPPAINKGDTTTATVIMNAGGGPPTLTLGESLFDTATVSGSPAAFTPTGTVTYTFTGTNGTSIASLTPPASWSGGGTNTWTETVTLTGTGAVPASDLTPALPAGSYQFTAS